MHLLHALLAPLWHGGPVPACQGRTHMPGWDQAPLLRVILVEGYVAGIVSAESGHVVGLNNRGHIFCSRLGNVLVAKIFLTRRGRFWVGWCGFGTFGTFCCLNRK